MLCLAPDTDPYDIYNNIFLMTLSQSSITSPQTFTILSQKLLPLNTDKKQLFYGPKQIRSSISFH